jgi:hypothetical protein
VLVIRFDPSPSRVPPAANGACGRPVPTVALVSARPHTTAARVDGARDLLTVDGISSLSVPSTDRIDGRTRVRRTRDPVVAGADFVLLIALGRPCGNICEDCDGTAASRRSNGDPRRFRRQTTDPGVLVPVRSQSIRSAVRYDDSPQPPPKCPFSAAAAAAAAVADVRS